jgi:hypothetical protein
MKIRAKIMEKQGLLMQAVCPHQSLHMFGEIGLHLIATNLLNDRAQQKI